MSFIISGDGDLRMAYEYLGFLKTQKRSELVKKELNSTKREIRKYSKKQEELKTIKSDLKFDISKITLPKSLSSSEEADNYFNRIWNFHNEGKFAVEIVTDWHKIVKKKDGSYVAYCKNHYEDAKGAAI